VCRRSFPFLERWNLFLFFSTCFCPAFCGSFFLSPSFPPSSSRNVLALSLFPRSSLRSSCFGGFPDPFPPPLRRSFGQSERPVFLLRGGPLSLNRPHVLSVFSCAFFSNACFPFQGYSLLVSLEPRRDTPVFQMF